MFVKQYAPLSAFLSQTFVELDKSVQNKLQKCMKKKFIFGKLLLKQSEMVLAQLTRSPSPLTTQ